MPIYAYKCAACGFAKDVLRKLSDPALTQCPSCQAESFEKQVTAAGFQLKGSGWYVTDFRDGGKPGAGASSGSESAASAATAAPTPTPSVSSPSTGGNSTSAAPVASTPVASAPAASGSGSTS
ncbi:MAG: zinc ribbon domain-containing protein [Burkholderiaceae bacterium]|nr:zinc ribbon domain-containing protein [Burkholderiaceae bacterium]